MRTFAEQLEYDLQHDDIKLAELIAEWDRNDQELAGRVAYAIVNKDWGYLTRYVDGMVADEIAERQRENDDRMLAAYDGVEP